MVPYFAYGSNMSRAVMAQHCPDAVALGIAILPGWGFTISPEGYGSIVPQTGGKVLGVLWDVSARDMAGLDDYESVDTGLYRRSHLSVLHDGLQVSALVYIVPRREVGPPKPGYIETVASAARDWALPESYILEIEGWAPGGAHAIYEHTSG
jgi:gamma-glutamylcyclotransferase (GGCT)/AIG2-like uncharacterized protein YtfP